MMLESLKQSGRDLGLTINRAWRTSAEGWRELLHHSSEALTHFTHRKEKHADESTWLDNFPQWGLLAGEIEETEKEVVVRMEVPGMSREDCRIMTEGSTLCITGEKQSEREEHGSTYHMNERAYGSFQRSIPLPGYVDIDNAKASCKNGVLTVRMPKISSKLPKTIRVN
jgi:HSP20 family protein